MEFSRQEYCSGLPFPSPGDLLDPRIETDSSVLQAESLPSVPPGKPPVVQKYINFILIDNHGMLYTIVHHLFIYVLTYLDIKFEVTTH